MSSHRCVKSIYVTFSLEGNYLDVVGKTGTSEERFITDIYKALENAGVDKTRLGSITLS